MLNLNFLKTSKNFKSGNEIFAKCQTNHYMYGYHHQQTTERLFAGAP